MLLRAAHYIYRSVLSTYIPFAKIGCAQEGYPGVFARVSAGLEWINNTVCGEIGDWCIKDDEYDECFGIEDEDPEHIVMVRPRSVFCCY